MATITYVNLSWRSTTDGVGNTYSPDSGIAGGAVDGEQIDQIRSVQMLARQLTSVCRPPRNPAETVKRTQAFDGEAQVM